MITTLETYQKEPFRLPNAVPTPMGADNTEAIETAISIHERELLIDGLGFGLFSEVENAADDLDNSPLHIQQLVRGFSYDVDGTQMRWEGLYTMLAYYVYYKFTTQVLDTLSTFGVERPEGQNSESVSAIPRATNAYREFFKRYQGQETGPREVRSAFGVGLDYYGSRNTNRSLNQFLDDRNEDYPDADFTYKENINSMGL